MRAPLPRPVHRRRGVTLVEMLVVVALVILMMVILVQIFQTATSAMSASRAIQELDVELRQVDLRIRQDLAGVTARFTPPLDPALKLGYFEYGENAFPDAQGEDTDDYIAFTTKAPEGQVFTGRLYIQNNAAGVAGNQAVQPVTVTSQLAEIVYFLRNGNLYRRVFLIAPEKQSAVSGGGILNQFPALGSSAVVSWIGVHDFSCRPAPTGSTTSLPLLNDLGTLTNRENRRFSPRLRTDYVSFSPTGGGYTAGPDGVDDDTNGDDIPDYYPTLYPDLFQQYPANNTSPGLINENLAAFASVSGINPRTNPSLDVYAFPYVYPGMFSKPETKGGYSLATGWIHSLDPSQTTFNHSPLLNGDSLAVPSQLLTDGQAQTWWGFPTWRETLTGKGPADAAAIISWIDPRLGLNVGASTTQQVGLRPFSPISVPAITSTGFLPPVPTQFANDGAGSLSFSKFSNVAGNIQSNGLWDDDLILTNVRSFDIKAYDANAPLYINPLPNVILPGAYAVTATGGTPTATPFLPTAGYYDLGYGHQGHNSTLKNPGLSLNTGTPKSLWDSNNQPQGFGHAGRIPPLAGTVITGPGGDNRVNPSRPVNPFNNIDGLNYVGDNGSTLGITRLTRVWDSWSTDYSNAPDVDINLRGYPPQLPIYPSYPAPYTSPLRGIQIQIRVSDPRSEHIKVLTIRQDFTDKL